jgi:superfamily II DNA or RNA helicase
MATEHFLQSGIRDNRKRGSVGDYLKKHVSSESQLSFVSAYFTIYAFNQLKEHLNEIGELRFLFGEPSFLKQIDPEKTDKKVFDIEDEKLSLNSRLQQNKVAKECAEWIEEKAEIRSIIYPNFLHGKLYHIEKNGVENAIMGSSNFTVNGLGLGSSRNVELNLIVDSQRDKEDLKAWFDDVWSNQELVQDVKDEVLQYLGELYADYSPEFIYQKTLYHLFEGVLKDENEAERKQTQLLLAQTQIWNTLYGFQKVAVQSAISKIQKHNGCIIADSVGLGKTFEALAVIKFFECRNQNVLVLCPKKLRENWTVYQSSVGNTLNPFPADRFNFTVLSHTDLSRDRGMAGNVNLGNFHWDNYDLVVIDESHNFRNNSKGKKDEDGNIIRRSRYERLMEDIIKSGSKTKVLLLSATPVNTDLRDLRNQIYLLTGDDDQAFRDTIGVSSLKDTLAYTQRQFNEWAEDSKKNGHDRRSLLSKLNPAFFKLLDELTIARSRKHVEQYYEESIEAIGNFPKRSAPRSIYSAIDTRGLFMSYDRLNTEISNYKLAVFNPAKYVTKENREKYFSQKVVANFSQEERESHLIGMMKVNFLKRLESSVNSFAITLGKTIVKIEDLEKRIKHFKEKQQMEMFDLETFEVFDQDDEELNEAFQIGAKLKYDLRHLDIDKWLKELQEDKQQLDLIRSQAVQIDAERDAKLQELKAIIREKVTSPTTNRNGNSNKKVLVFTAFADTAEYLFQSLEKWAKDDLGIHLGLVTGGGGNKASFGRLYFNEILTNFSPFAKQRHKIASMPQDVEIDLLIATDCISEGQNLQDCDLVINYDIHWNPVRLIQRFGRIDRLGSQNDSVQLVNFWPTEDLNAYLNLKNRVEARMALVDVSTTSSDNILLPAEMEKLAKDDLNYRDQQLLRLKDEILDLEDFNESIALNDFSLDDFRAELSDQIESVRNQLRTAPLGINAIAPSVEENPSGVIFCLEQRKVVGQAEKVNPLQPFYLVYVRNDGAVYYSFIQAKQVLETFRALCKGHSQPIDELCKLFNQETKNGENMSTYDELLKSALSEVKKNFKSRNESNLFTGRGGTLVGSHEDSFESENFRLITWLVVR